ncbi:MAG: glycosyltransferase [Gemmatimonadaceae bacterium]|nr:glycosyltransferase [Gemmatimonadaceae bacterium]MCW5827297.1 glycosyltransferase [Gemmatimonadaceae bacterium]
MTLDLTTFVTGIWDLGRDQAGTGFRRDFAQYRERFGELLLADAPMVIYGDPTLREFVEAQRAGRPTQFIERPAASFRERFDLYRLVEAIRLNPAWRAQATWLAESPQATLPLYNPMVMSKMFLLNDARIGNPFGSSHFAWIDGAITSTVPAQLFSEERVLDRVWSLLDRFFFVSFPYRDGAEIHGFTRAGMRRFSGVDPQYVCRGGFFGGHRDVLAEVNEHYYALLSATLHEGEMGTEESVFTLMALEEPELYRRYELRDEDHGLLQPFFEFVRTLPRPAPNATYRAVSPDPLATRKERRRALALARPERRISGYVVTFNAPDQLTRTLESWRAGFRFEQLFILDHSTEDEAKAENRQVAERFGASILYHPKGNGGISGGRQFVAEHFDATDADYYVFIEDDMLLNDASAPPLCRSGFRSYVPELRDVVLHIMELEQYDALKLSFTEFYGTNNVQVAWYNVSDATRAAVWPEQPKLPRTGVDPDGPSTRFETIRRVGDVSYADGEVYYCNWPQLVSRAGNRRLFLESPLPDPSEASWMADFFERTLRGEVRLAVLLASVITHDRFHHYAAGERREN